MKNIFVKMGVVTGLTLIVAGFAPLLVSADNIGPITFESPTYVTGTISGQDGWSNAVNPAYDQGVVVNTYGYASFGNQAFRISDAVTSGSFGDWVFAKPLTDSVGETGATAGSFSIGTKQTHFETEFDIASTLPNAQQPGLHISVSPDRGDGSRMSYLRFEDGTSGINVFFDDVTSTGLPGSDLFHETQVGTNLNRTVPHHIKLTMDVVDGPSNDVVKVWIDGVLVHTGTSWEDYYRYDPESSAEQSPRIVKTVIIQSRTGSGPVTNPADAGKGFLIDNLSLMSGPTPVSLAVVTNAATNIISSDATLNGMNGDSNATDHLFWVSLNPINTTTPNAPLGVYSMPGMGPIAANTPFSVALSSFTTLAFPSNMPAVTPNTTYYFVAWSQVNGTWYPGVVLNFTTAPVIPPVVAPTNKNECMNNGWTTFYKNQGTCVSHFTANQHANK